ncbi:hypothetical protein OG897_06140 [Streptomyces sp. NBC_00237]|uniref:hypothetical protein n=1 Tax=Streptomyces sp. NBC_00237 TaxID=2975687 RepID=UPI00225660CB|nr:hypothetical protein [Streptomyces sp. NBC_00237]MCX5201041.1 hypothetical protein [Streptomyces sp. NBC_00237]
MADSRLNFILSGRDQLSRVLDRAGDAANRMGRRLLVAQIEGSAAINRLADTSANRLAGMQKDADANGKAVEALKKTFVSLAPAAIPAAAGIAGALAPIAAGTGAAAVAAAAYGAALGPQIKAMGEASEAEKKHAEAVAKSGARSKEAAAAQAEYAKVMAKLPPEVQRASAQLSVLKDTYQAWSDGLAKDTMSPVIKGISLFTGLLPKARGLVRGTSGELDRMVTILGGGMATPGFDATVGRFERFATGTLSKVNDGIVRLMRTGDTGKIGGGLQEFMTFAQAQGPVVGSVLTNLGQALLNVLRAGSEVGVGMLQAVDVLARIVSAVPPGAIAALLQLAVAMRVVKLAALGFAAARTAMAAFGVQLVAMQAAAAATPGRLAAVTASLGALSRGAKLALAGTGIGLLVIALGELMSIGKQAPPDIDKMTSSIGQFAQGGKLSGEAARVLGTDLGELEISLRTLSRPSNYESTVQGLTKIFGMDSTAVKTSKEQVGALDQALAQLVKGGNPQLAEAALKRTAAGLGELGKSELRGQLTQYKDALRDMAFEAKLVADSQGLFGAQAQQVQAKLAAQKASADGLRQSLQALNDVNRQGLSGMIGFEAALDATTAAIKGNETALSMSGGQLDLNSAKARTAAGALNDLAAKTDEAAAQARQSGASWSTVNGIYEKGRTALIRAGDAMGLTRQQAAALAAQILRTPDKTARLRGNLDDLQAKLTSAKAQLGRVPDSRKAAIRAQIAQLEAQVAAAKRALASIQNKTVTVRTNYVQTVAAQQKPSWMLASGGLVGYASGGLTGYPGGGAVRGPGTGTSDSILAMVSNGEYVIRARSVAKYGLDFLNALNAGQLGMSGLGGSAMAGAGAEVGRGLSSGMAASAGGVESSARAMAAAVSAGVRGELEIASPSKKMQALAKQAGQGLIVGLTGSASKIASTAKSLASAIWAAFKGRRTNVDSWLVAKLNRENVRLQGLAKQRDALASKIATAKAYATDLTTKAREGAALGALGLDAEEVSAGSIKGGLAAKLSKIKTFTSYVNALAKRGLSKSLLRQILDMGPEQGYAYASALAGSNSKVLSSINSTQGQIEKASASLGNAGADAMYDSGRMAGKGFLTGLLGQQKDIEAAMLRIAKGMQKSIKQALGIRSPSRVMAEMGRYSTEGLALGLVDRLPAVDRAMGVVSSRVTSARPAITAGTSGGRGGAAPVYVQIDVHGALDPVAVGRELRRTLLELKRVHGVNVVLGVG